MFFSRKKNNTITDQLEQPDIPLPCPTATTLSIHPTEKELIEKYTDIAQHIGFDPFPLQYKRLLLFLEKNDIPVFDYEQVADYLESKLQKDQHWQWTPLRKQDMESSDQNKPSWWYHGYRANTPKGLPLYPSDINSPRYCGMTFPYQHYNKLVPRAVLTQVAKIAAEFPTARFYVSEIAEYQDPFMCVSFETRYDRTDQITRIIFATWDEPGW